MTDLSRAQVEQLRPLATTDKQVVRLDEHGSHVGVYTALALMLDTDASLRSRLEGVEKERDFYKKMWEIRGKALAKGCPNCQYVQAEVKPKKQEAQP